MKRETTRLAAIGPACFLAFGLLLSAAGIGAFVSPWYLDGGVVGWFLDVEPSRPGQFTRTPLGVIISAVPAILSGVVGIWLVGFGLPCGAAGLVIGLLGLSTQGTKSRSWDGRTSTAARSRTRGYRS